MIKSFVTANYEMMFKSIAELVEIESVMSHKSDNSPFGDNCRIALEKALEIAENLGFQTKNFDNYVGTAEYIPEGSAEIGLAILCHLDVVPAGDGWSVPPYIVTVKDGNLVGRGVIDDKGPAMAALFGLYAVKELAIPLSKGVRIIFGTNEENGSEDLEYYLKQENLPENVFTPDGEFPVINIEKGMMRSVFNGKHTHNNDDYIVNILGGTIPNAVPAKACCVMTIDVIDDIKLAISKSKSSCKFEITDTSEESFKVTATGNSAHASMPETGVNAITELIALATSIAKVETEQIKLLRGLLKLFPKGETDGLSLGVKASDETGNTTAVFSIFSMAEGNFKGTIDVRFPSCLNLDEVKSRETLSLKSVGFTFESFMGDEPHHTDESSEFIQSLLAVYQEQTGKKGYCKAIGGGTYVHNISGGVAFGAEFGKTNYHMHGADEFIPINELILDSTIYGEAIAKICK